VYFDGSSTALEPDTEIVLQRFERDPANGATAIIVQQPLGTSWTRAEETGHPLSGFLLASAAGRFFARGSQFSASVAPEGTTSVISVEGTVFGRAQNADAEIPAGFAVRVAPGQPPEAPLPAALGSATLQVRVEGPVQALLTDARGRSLGYHPRADRSVSQIPYARLIQSEDNVQTFTVPGPTEEYTLTLRGTGSGDVAIAVGTLRAGARSAPAAALLRGWATASDIQGTSFGWTNGDIRELRDLAPVPGAPAASAVALVRQPPVALAVAPTAAPTAGATEDEADAAAVVEPDPADVFASFDTPAASLRPLVVAPVPPAPQRPAVVSAPAPGAAPAPLPRAPERPQVVSGAARPGDEDPLDLPPTAVPTAEIRVVTATPVPPTPVPPTPVPPTPLPPTPVPPTREPTVPPALPTPVPTAAPQRGAPARATVATQPKPAIAPTSTPVTGPATGAAPTRCTTPVC
jgi:hypothetical protein